MAKTSNPFLEKCLREAVEAGSPQDQIKRLLEDAGYVPYPWQWKFHAAAREADYEDGPVDIGAGGARGPGKSHVVLSQVALDDCQRVEGLKCLFLRQTGVSAQESFDDLITKAVKGRAEYHKSKNALKFPNGSRVLLGGFRDEREIDKYIGIEYDIIIVEELTQLTREKYLKLKGSLRTSKPNWRPRIYASFNPGGIGHAWVRERFVLPSRAGTNVYLDPDTKKETVIRFIPSTYKENPALNPEYTTYLEGLGGSLGRAWREGNWDAFEGQYFSEWDHTRHVVAPFLLPPTWRRFRSIDPSGRDGITSCHWYAVDSNGRVWVYREYYYGIGVKRKDGTTIEIGRDYDEHAKAIAALSRDEDGIEEVYEYTIIDTAAFSKAGFSETAAEIFERNGVTGLLPAAKERLIGWNAVHTYLRWQPEEGSQDGYTQPKLQIFSTCVNMARTLPLLLHDDIHPEDVDSRGEDHAADELRYFLRTLRDTKSEKPLSPVERRLTVLRKQISGTGFDYSYSRK